MLQHYATTALEEGGKGNWNSRKKEKRDGIEIDMQEKEKGGVELSSTHCLALNRFFLCFISDSFFQTGPSPAFAFSS